MSDSELNGDPTILTVIGVDGSLLTSSSDGFCIRLKIADAEDIFYTNLSEGKSPIWNESFVL